MSSLSALSSSDFRLIWTLRSAASPAALANTPATPASLTARTLPSLAACSASLTVARQASAVRSGTRAASSSASGSWRRRRHLIQEGPDRNAVAQWRALQAQLEDLIAPEVLEVERVLGGIQECGLGHQTHDLASRDRGPVAGGLALNQRQHAM